MIMDQFGNPSFKKFYVQFQIFEFEIEETTINLDKDFSHIAIFFLEISKIRKCSIASKEISVLICSGSITELKPKSPGFKFWIRQSW
jgi:hypothetical protein